MDPNPHDDMRFLETVQTVVANSGLVAAFLPEVLRTPRSPDGVPLDRSVEDRFVRPRWCVGKEYRGGPSIVFGKPPLQENPKNALDR